MVKGGGAKFAEQHQVPLLAQLPLEEQIRESGDVGHPQVLKEGASAEAFKSLAQNLAQEIAIRNAQQPKTSKVEMNL